MHRPSSEGGWDGHQCAATGARSPKKAWALASGDPAVTTTPTPIRPRQRNATPSRGADRRRENRVCTLLGFYGHRLTARNRYSPHHGYSAYHLRGKAAAVVGAH